MPEKPQIKHLTVELAREIEKAKLQTILDQDQNITGVIVPYGLWLRTTEALEEYFGYGLE